MITCLSTTARAHTVSLSLLFITWLLSSLSLLFITWLLLLSIITCLSIHDRTCSWRQVPYWFLCGRVVVVHLRYARFVTGFFALLQVSLLCYSFLCFVTAFFALLQVFQARYWSQVCVCVCVCVYVNGADLLQGSLLSNRCTGWYYVC